MGGAAARDRHDGLALRLPQARRVHPAERRHARLLCRRNSSDWRWLVLSCRGGLGKMVSRPRRRAAPCADRGAAPRGAVPSARRPIDPPRIAFGANGGHRRRRAGALAESPSADRAPDRQGARRMGGARVIAGQNAEPPAAGTHERRETAVALTTEPTVPCQDDVAECERRPDAHRLGAALRARHHTFGLPHRLDIGEHLPRPYFGGRPNGRLMDKWTRGILNIGYAPAARIGTR